MADKFINDVKEITAICLADPKACDVGSAAVYGMAQSLPDRSIVDQITRAYLDSLYAIKSLQWSTTYQDNLWLLFYWLF